MSQNLASLQGFLSGFICSLVCLLLVVDTRAACGLSDTFSLQCEKGKKNQEYAKFFEKIHLFLILISEFQQGCTSDRLS